MKDLMGPNFFKVRYMILEIGEKPIQQLLSVVPGHWNQTKAVFMEILLQQSTCVSCEMISVSGN